MGTEYDAVVSARRAFAAWQVETDHSKLTERERGHVAAAQTWLSGDLPGAGVALRRLTDAYPRDLLALSVGHQIDFLTGNATELRDRVASALTAWSPDDPGHSLLLGMHAFGLEETGDYRRSEQVGRAAVAGDAKDVWGIHAVVHTYEMEARFMDGLRYFDERVGDFDQGNFFRVHNWWHYCLFALEAGRPDLALVIYSPVLRPREADPAAMELLDATALLWRLSGRGRGTKRFAVLADDWTPKMRVAHYAFNDLHATMAYVGSGRADRADALIADRIGYLRTPPAGDANVAFTARVGVPGCRAVAAFGRGRWDEVVDLLFPIRHQLHVCGGSHAQRDALQRTLLEAAIRGRRTALARQLLTERLGRKPGSPYNWRMLGALDRSEGNIARADAEARRAASLAGGASPVFAALGALDGA